MIKHKPVRNKFIKIFLITFLIVFTLPLFIPVDEPKDLVEAGTLADADSKFINVRGVNIHYKEKGSGNNVYVLLHGFGASLYSWHEVTDYLAKKGRVIAFDRPAFGLTDRPTSWGKFNPYAPESQVELTIGLMDKLGINKANLIGHSAGGVIALNTALKYPNRFSSLVLVDPYVGQATVPKWALGFLAWPQVDRFGPLIARSIGSNFDELLKSFWYDPGKLTQADFDAYGQPFKIKNWDKALWSLTKSTYSLEPEKRLSELYIPVLVINGDNDPIVKYQDSRALAEKIKNSKYVTIQNSGHIPQEEQPEEFIRALDQFNF